MTYNLNTYIITLNKSIEDFNNYKELEPEIIHGINGKNLNINDNKLSLSYFNYNFLPKSIIGCGLSHIKCWKKHILNSNNYTLILEDDIFTESNMNNVIKTIGLKNIIDIYLKHVPKDFDILYLGYISGDLINFYFNKSRQYKSINNFIAIPNIALGLHSYIISDRGIINLLNNINIKSINFHIDTYIQSLANQKKINTYVTIPRLFYQTSTFKTHSTLSPLIKCPFFKTIFIDKYVSLNYIINVGLFSIYNIDFNVWIIFLLLITLIILHKLLCFFRKFGSMSFRINFSC